MSATMNPSASSVSDVLHVLENIQHKYRQHITNFYGRRPGEVTLVHPETLETVEDPQWTYLFLQLRFDNNECFRIRLSFAGQPRLVDGRYRLDDYCCERVEISLEGLGEISNGDLLWDSYIAFLSLTPLPQPSNPLWDVYLTGLLQPGLSVRPRLLVPNDLFNPTNSAIEQPELDHYGPMIHLTTDQLSTVGGLETLKQTFPTATIADLRNLSPDHGVAVYLIQPFSSVTKDLLNQWRTFLNPLLTNGTTIRDEVTVLTEMSPIAARVLLEMFRSGIEAGIATLESHYLTDQDEQTLFETTAGEDAPLTGELKDEIWAAGVLPLGSFGTPDSGPEGRGNGLFVWFPGRTEPVFGIDAPASSNELPGTQGLVVAGSVSVQQLARRADSTPFLAWMRVVYPRSGDTPRPEWMLGFYGHNAKSIMLTVRFPKSGMKISSMANLERINECVSDLGFGDVALQPDCWGSLAESRLNVEAFLGISHRILKTGVYANVKRANTSTQRIHTDQTDGLIQPPGTAPLGISNLIDLSRSVWAADPITQSYSGAG